jgi:hypothetical protein
MIGLSHEKTALTARDGLIESGWLVVEKGRKGFPNRYRIAVPDATPYSIKGSFSYPQTTPQTTPQTGVATPHLRRAGRPNPAERGKGMNTKAITTTESIDRAELIDTATTIEETANKAGQAAAVVGVVYDLYFSCPKMDAKRVAAGYVVMQTLLELVNSMLREHVSTLADVAETVLKADWA